MKIFAISDLHLSFSSNKPMNIFGWDPLYHEIIKKDWESKVGDSDVVLVAGDISWAMNLEDAKKDIEFINNLPGYKVLIKGNHDYWWSSYAKVKALTGEKCFPIQNNAFKIGNYIFCGTRGWSLADQENPANNQKIYDREQLRLKMSIDEAKKLQKDGDRIIALIHYPPYNNNYSKSPFTKIFDEAQIDTVVYGHIHSLERDLFKVVCKINNTTYYLTSCDILDNKLLQII